METLTPLQESLQEEIKRQMTFMETSSFKPRVNAEQMLDFLSRAQNEQRLNVAALVASNDFNRLAYGRLTEKLYGYTEKADDGKEYVREGKFYLAGQGEETRLEVIPRYTLEQDRSQYKGHAFSYEERGNLFANGQAGAIIPIDLNYGKEGTEPNVVGCYVSFDRDLNRFRHLPAEKVPERAFDHFFGKKLDEEQVKTLREGKPLLISETGKDGKEHRVVIQFDAFEFGLKKCPALFFAPKKFLGVELSDDQRRNLAEGKDVELEGMKKKDGTTFSALIRMGEKANITFAPRATKQNLGKATVAIAGNENPGKQQEAKKNAKKAAKKSLALA